MTIPSPWAVLLIKFSDDPDDERDRSIYEQLFTTAGVGTNNMLDFFSDMSHGRLDLSGSQVFGWFRIDQPRRNYDGLAQPPLAPGVVNRAGLVAAGRAAAQAAGVDLSRFAGVVITTYGQTDLCGFYGGMSAICDPLSLQPSLLGQEMGHGYGLDHARVDGSTADYMDPWDVMSTAVWPSYEQPDPSYTNIGPGLNAQCMRSRGWLDESRVWHGSDAYDAVVTLRPLHWREVPGFLAAQIGEFLVEFRVPERWDAAIDTPVVLVHRFAENHSYLMPAVDGARSLTVGSVFTSGREDWPYEPFLRVEVLAIDAAAHTATLQLGRRPAHPIPQPQWDGVLIGSAQVDGVGALVLRGGQGDSHTSTRSCSGTAGAPRPIRPN
jgi:hypothetical protein